MAFRHALAFSLALALAAPALSAADGGTVVTKGSELQWKDLGNGISAAPVSGDMGKGPSRFFLKYPVGLTTPRHHHDTDHYVTVISGHLTLTVDGKDHDLGPGDYFALTRKATHVAKVLGKEPAVFFIQADGPWNVVMEQ